MRNLFEWAIVVVALPFTAVAFVGCLAAAAVIELGYGRK